MRVEKKTETLAKLKNSKELYVIMSRYTRLPHVVCDPETYDDEILLFYMEEDAKKEAERLRHEKNAVQAAKVEQKDFLQFYMSLYPMGVNCLLVNGNTSSPAAVQLSDLLRRSPVDRRPEGPMQIENPELYLTAIYFMQELRRHPGGEMPEEVKELHEELLAHFQKGKYIVAARQDKSLVVLKEKDGQVFQPIFTDYMEFGKFNREKKFRPAVIEAEKLIEMVSRGKLGLAVNPFSVNVRFQIMPKDMQKMHS